MEKEVSCINSRAILEYTKSHNNGDCSFLIENLHPDIDKLSDPESFLKDPNNWISCGLASELYERASRFFKDKRLAYKIARYAIENTSLGYTQRILVKAFWSYKNALKHAQKINDTYNRNKRVELAEIGKNEAIVRLHWDGSMQVSKHFCLMNQGSYTYMPTVWGGRPLTLVENCCFFEGAPYCEYHLRWTARNRFHEVFSRFFGSKAVLMETIREMEEDKRIIEEKYEEVSRLNMELDRKIRQVTAIQETGKAILSLLELDQLLKSIMNLLSNVCEINRALIMLVNEDEGCLEYLYGVGFEGGVPEAIRNYKIPLDRVSNLLVRVTNTGRSEYVPDIRSSKLRKENIMLLYGQPTSAYVVPLITRSKVIGILATDGIGGKGVPEETRETLNIFAPQIAIAIENAKLYSRLKEQMEELKRSQRLLSRAEKFSFLGNLAARLAHEIKNPMTAIGTFIQLLPSKYDDEEFRNDFYKIALEETQRVNNLITELLDLVKTKESHFEYNEFHTLIDRMVLLLSPQSNEKKIDIIRRYDKEIGKVWLDAEKMKQVIINLLSNAVEFTPEGGKIEITTQRITRDGRTQGFRLEIKDNGLGIEEANIDKIFDPYFTTKLKSSLHNGTGLGLFITYQNVRDHGGTIEVKSKVNEGTSFILNFPSYPSDSFLNSKDR
ncbi:MAG: GAF domain-containing protein [Deltaproteobacteria bacterium]|nr:GAF domain-containing protein [Deltaproteobacteria bacterium]